MKKEDCLATLLRDMFSRKFCWITLGKYFIRWEMQLWDVAIHNCRLNSKVYGVTAAHAREKRAVRLLYILLPCPYLVVFWIGYLVRESWFTSPLCWLGKVFLFSQKVGISECCKYSPTRHFIVSPHLLWKLIMWYKILKFSLGHNNPTFQENAFEAIRNN